MVLALKFPQQLPDHIPSPRSPKEKELIEAAKRSCACYLNSRLKGHQSRSHQLSSQDRFCLDPISAFFDRQTQNWQETAQGLGGNGRSDLNSWLAPVGKGLSILWRPDKWALFNIELFLTMLALCSSSLQTPQRTLPSVKQKDAGSESIKYCFLFACGKEKNISSSSPT